MLRIATDDRLSLLLGSACCLAAARRRAALGWPALGVTIVSIIGRTNKLDACWPHGPNAPGALCLAVSAIPPFQDLAITIVRALATCALTLGPFLWWRRRAAIVSS